MDVSVICYAYIKICVWLSYIKVLKYQSTSSYMRVVGKQQEGLLPTAAGFKHCRSISQAHYTLNPTTKTSLAMTNSSQQNYSSWHILVGVDRCFVPSSLWLGHLLLINITIATQTYSRQYSINRFHISYHIVQQQ